MRVLDFKQHGVTLGSFDKDFRQFEELVQVTFEDYQGIVHTVHAHKDGPFKTAEAIMEAFYQGTLHPNPVVPVAQVAPVTQAAGSGF